MDKKIIIIFTIIGVTAIGIFGYFITTDVMLDSEINLKDTETSNDTMTPKKGISLKEEHSSIEREYHDLQRAYSNGNVSKEEYHITIGTLQQRELVVFEKARNYEWDDSEITEYNYFFRGVMKFPTSLQMHSDNDMPPVFDDSNKLAYCKLMDEFDAANAEFHSIHPVPKEEDFENGIGYHEALDEYVSLVTNNPRLMELEEQKSVFGNVEYIECN